MQQQQLLLLVLGFVVIGLVVIVGVKAHSESQVKENQNALVNDALRIASDAQAWKLKPAAFGGGADTEDNNFNTFSLKKAGYDVNDNGEYVSPNGTFTIEANNNNLIIRGKNKEHRNRVEVVITGTTADDILTQVNKWPAIP